MRLYSSVVKRWTAQDCTSSRSLSVTRTRGIIVVLIVWVLACGPRQRKCLGIDTALQAFSYPPCNEYPRSPKVYLLGPSLFSQYRMQSPKCVRWVGFVNHASEIGVRVAFAGPPPPARA